MIRVRRILLTLSLFAFLSSLGGCLTYNIREEIKRIEFYRQQEESRAKGGITFSGPYCFPDPHPPILAKIVFLSGLIFFLLLAFRNPLWVTPFALLSFANYPYWYWNTQREIAMAEAYWISGLQSYLLNASLLDAAAAFLTSLLVFTLLTLNLAALVLFIKRRRLP